METTQHHRRTSIPASARPIPLLLVTVLLLVQATPLPTHRAPAIAQAGMGEATQATIYLEPVADATLDQTRPTVPLGLEPDLRIFWQGQNEAARALLRFNLAAALPPEAIIETSFLELFLESGSAEGLVDITASNVLADWIEAEVTWESQPDAGDPATVNTTDAGSGVRRLDVTEVVQAWHNQPHYGLLLSGAEASAPYDYTFASRSAEAVETRPRLEVTYHLPLPTELGFAGQVTLGEPPEPGEPLPGATLELYGDGDSSPTNGRGLWLDGASSNGAGAFELSYSGEPFAFYHVVQTGPEGTYPSGAAADPPGRVTAPSIVTFEEPGSGIYEGIGFWNLERPEGCDELLANGNFEASEMEAWGNSGAVTLGPGREGGQAAQFAGSDEVMGELWQGVTIPFEAAPVVLTFWWMAEAETQQPGDALDVIMQHPGGDDQLLSLPATGELGTWRYGALDLTGYGGTQVGVTFLARTDGEVPTTFRVDDVRLTSCGGFLPDLVVTDLWPEENRICYQIRNQGDYDAPEGHTTELLRPEVGSLAWDWIDATLAPGARQVRCFDYEWTCAGPFDALLVRTDAGSVVPEWDNDNNWREESWQCDVSPPKILTGPTVAAITETSAVVTWETDEPGDTQLFYSTLSRGPGVEAFSPELVPIHEVSLSDLVPSTVYSYTVTSADEMGNRSAGVTGTFQTPPEDDGADPGVSLRELDDWRGTVQLVADASDNQRVEKVAFCLESGIGDAAQGATTGGDDFCLAGELLFTDYSPPFEAMVDTTQYANGDYTLTVRAYDASGRSATDQMGAQFANLVDPNAPIVTITNPTPGQIVSGKVQVTAQLNDDEGLAYAYFWINGQFGEFDPLPSHPKSATLTYDWDTTVVTTTNIIVAVEALDTKFNKGLDTVSVQVSQPSPPSQPKLKVTQHTVTRNKNAIEVALTVSNVGLGTARNIQVVDSLRGFQPISRRATAPHIVEYEASYVPSTKLWQEAISDTLALAPGASRTYTYPAIPVMVYPGPPSPSVGETVYLYYEDTASQELSSQVQIPVMLTTGGTSVGQAWNEALKQATYLIVTNPQRLSWVHVNTGPVDDLLSAMAELAYHKDGALGYLYVNDKYALDALIEPFNVASWTKYGDNWSVRLHPNFLKLMGGALLIVGEVEIVPAWQSSFSVGWSPVLYSDQPYADTGGSPAPELLVGRIVGDKATTMIKPIRASIGVHTGAPGYAFDQLKAMTVSGPGLGTFVQDVDDATLILHDAGWLVAEVHTKKYFQIGDFSRDYEPGDDLAVGEVDSFNSNEEIVVADKSTNKVYIYDKNGTSLAEFYVGYGSNAFDDGDQITLASGKIVMADASADRILVYGYDAGWALETSFSVAFDPGDLLASGDVVSTAPLEEIVVADHSADQVEYYSVAGLKYTQKVSATFDPRDLMAVGDVLGDGKDEIVLGDRSSGKLLIYSGQGALLGSHQLKDVTVDGKTMTRLEYYDYDVKSAKDVGGSGLAIGELFPYPSEANSGKEEILLAPARNFEHLFPIWWYPSKGEFRSAAAIPWDFSEYDGLAIGEMGTYLNLAQDEILVADQVGYVRLLDTNNWQSRWNAAKPIYFPNTDLLFLSGHGNVSGCCGLSSYDNGTFPIDFNEHNPVAVGMSCLTGNYQDGGDSNNFPDRLLDSGTAVYIGATKESSGYQNREAAKWLFKNWDYGESIGKVFTELERSYWKGSVNDDWWFWAYEYNLYGDPLFAAATTATAQDTADGALFEEPLVIDVPDYVVTTTQGLDWVEIPGGRKRSEPGDLWLPYYTTLVEVPAGQRVQDVTLIERTGLVTDTGLILPMVPLTITACACSPEPYSGPVTDWYPQEVYDWEVLDNGDGSTALRVTVYPFSYNPLTTGSRFYQHYTFGVTTVPAEVMITGLTTGKGAVGLGQPVGIDVELVNAGAAQDLVVSTVIKAAGSGLPVAGLPLVALDSLQGPASLSMLWDSSGEPGSYLVEVTLLAADSGQVLDVETHNFGLDIANRTYLPLVVRHRP